MDFIGASKLLEKFVDAPPQPQPAENAESTMTTASIVSTFIGLIIGVYAAYLSWECNSALGISTPLKVIYAFFAWVFGLLYLIFYVIFRAGTCQAPAPAPAPALAPTPAPAASGGRR
jgi:hypothetical protein